MIKYEGTKEPEVYSFQTLTEQNLKYVKIITDTTDTDTEDKTYSLCFLKKRNCNNFSIYFLISDPSF